jgi:hypothetical protein
VPSHWEAGVKAHRCQQCPNTNNSLQCREDPKPGSYARRCRRRVGCRLGSGHGMCDAVAGAALRRVKHKLIMGVDHSPVLRLLDCATAVTTAPLISLM